MRGVPLVACPWLDATQQRGRDVLADDARAGSNVEDIARSIEGPLTNPGWATMIANTDLTLR